eukprot:m.311620 g.311620  ORF g.311620 m.311620 type:complete len:174 (+) comp89013_c0_seq1:142-663(+)
MSSKCDCYYSKTFIQHYRSQLSMCCFACNEVSTVGVVVRKCGNVSAPQFVVPACGEHSKVQRDGRDVPLNFLGVYYNNPSESDSLSTRVMIETANDSSPKQLLQKYKGSVRLPCFAMECDKPAKDGAHLIDAKIGVYLLPSCSDHNRPYSEESFPVKLFYLEGGALQICCKKL